MVNMFTGGLFNKLLLVNGNAPKELTRAIDKLETWPSCTRIIDEATQIADYLFYEYLGKTILTQNALIVFPEDEETFGVGYSKSPLVAFQNWRFLSGDSYLFYSNGLGKDMVEIIREDAICEDEETGERYIERKMPLSIHFLEGERLVKSVNLYD